MAAHLHAIGIRSFQRGINLLAVWYGKTQTITTFTEIFVIVCWPCCNLDGGSGFILSASTARIFKAGANIFATPAAANFSPPDAVGLPSSLQ